MARRVTLDDYERPVLLALVELTEADPGGSYGPLSSDLRRKVAEYTTDSALLQGGISQVLARLKTRKLVGAGEGRLPFRTFWPTRRGVEAARRAREEAS